MKMQVNLKIDSKIKKEAQKKAKELGLSLSSVVNVTLKQFARTGELELTSTRKMTPYLEKIITEARRDLKRETNTYGPFDTAEEMIESLNSKE